MKAGEIDKRANSPADRMETYGADIPAPKVFSSWMKTNGSRRSDKRAHVAADKMKTHGIGHDFLD